MLCSANEHLILAPTEIGNGEVPNLSAEGEEPAHIKVIGFADLNKGCALLSEELCELTLEQAVPSEVFRCPAGCSLKVRLRCF